MSAVAPSAVKGLTWGSHKVFFMAWGYTAVGLTLAYSLRKKEKEAHLQERVNYYMESGHYSHPWSKSVDNYSNNPKLAALKKVDYTKLISKPQ